MPVALLLLSGTAGGTPPAMDPQVGERFRFRGAPGALLVQDRRRQTWRAFHDYRFGPDCDDDGICWEDDIGWYYRSRFMRRLDDFYVRDDKLFVQACTTGCMGDERDPDEWAWFVIDLHAHTATRLEEPPDFAPDPEYFREEPPRPDLAAIAREISGPDADPAAAPAEHPAGWPAAEAREATRRAETERVAQRRTRDAALRVGHTFRDPLQSGGEGPEMVVVPAGSFLMGSPSYKGGRYDYEGPVHRVTIGAAFAVGVYEVTWEEYEQFVEATGYSVRNTCYVYETRNWEERTEWNWRDPGYRQSGAHPVICVSWTDAQAYVAWLTRESEAGYRLLSEAEWEYVARGGTATARYWGEGEQCLHANGADMAAKREYEGWRTVAACDDGYGHTAPAGSYMKNGFGLADVLGNVGEWVEDCWNGSYAGAPTDGTAWVTGKCTTRVVRGGSSYDIPRTLQVAYRNRHRIRDRSDYVGFRVARSLAH